MPLRLGSIDRVVVLGQRICRVSSAIVQIPLRRPRVWTNLNIDGPSIFPNWRESPLQFSNSSRGGGRKHRQIFEYRWEHPDDWKKPKKDPARAAKKYRTAVTPATISKRTRCGKESEYRSARPSNDPMTCPDSWKTAQGTASRLDFPNARA